jgi:hypothetical protein
MCEFSKGTKLKFNNNKKNSAVFLHISIEQFENGIKKSYIYNCFKINEILRKSIKIDFN